MLSNLSKSEQGYLFGLFEGDGYKYHEKKQRHYSVEFYFNSKKDLEIINKINKILEKINLKVSNKKDKRFNCVRVRVYSKELFNLIFKNIILKDKPDEFNLGFVSGIIDSEGHVNEKKGYISVANTNKRMLEQCQEFLNKIGVKSSVNKRKFNEKMKLDCYRMYISVSFKKTPHLSCKTAG